MRVSEQLSPAMSSLVRSGSPDDPPIPPHPLIQPSILPVASLLATYCSHFASLAFQKWACSFDFGNPVAADLWRSLIAVQYQPNPVKLNNTRSQRLTPSLVLRRRLMTYVSINFLLFLK